MADPLRHRLMVAADAFQTMGDAAHDTTLTTTTLAEHGRLLREAEAALAECEDHNPTFEASAETPWRCARCGLHRFHHYVPTEPAYCPPGEQGTSACGGKEG